MKGPRRPDPVNATWRFFGSVQLSIVQLCLLGLAGLAASLIPQIPYEVRSGAILYREWLQARRPTFGSLLPLVEAAGLFDIAHSWWFRLLLSWLAISLGVHVLSRLDALRAPGARVAARAPKERFSERADGKRTGTRLHPRSPGISLSTALPIAAAEVVVRSVLRSRGYALSSHGAGPGGHGDPPLLIGERNRWHRLGTLAAHLGIALVLIAGVGGRLLGFTDPTYTLPVGSTLPVGHGTELSLRANDFAASYNIGVDVPRDYVANVALLEGGAPVVEHHELRVNSPLRHEGVSFHLASFGPAVDLRVAGPGGQALYNQGVALSYLDTDHRPSGYLELPGYKLWVIAPRLNAADPVVRPGEVRLKVYRTDAGGERLVAELDAPHGKTVAAAGLFVLFERERQYVGLRITRNPGVPFVWGGVVLSLLGTLYAFYFPYRQARASIEELPGGATVVLASGPGRAMGRERELASVASDLRTALDIAARWRGGSAQVPVTRARGGV